MSVKISIIFLLCANYSGAVHFLSDEELEAARQIGIKQAEQVNNEIPLENAYKLVHLLMQIVKNRNGFSSYPEYLYQETKCKKETVKKTEERNRCRSGYHTQNMKSVLCGKGINTCHKTGDKYKLPLDTGHGLALATFSAKAYNDKNNKSGNLKVGLHDAVTLTSPVERELMAGSWKDIVYFSTREIEFPPNGDNNPDVKVAVTKPKMDCKSIVTTYPVNVGPKEREYEVTCEESKTAIPALPPYTHKIEVCFADILFVNGTRSPVKLSYCQEPLPLKDGKSR